MRASPLVLGRIARTPSAPTPKWRSQISRTVAGSSGERPACSSWRAAGCPGRRSTTTKSFPVPSALTNGSGMARPVVYGLRGRRCRLGRLGRLSALAGRSPAGAPSAGAACLRLRVVAAGLSAAWRSSRQPCPRAWSWPPASRPWPLPQARRGPSARSRRAQPRRPPRRRSSSGRSRAPSRGRPSASRPGRRRPSSRPTCARPASAADANPAGWRSAPARATSAGRETP